MLEVIESILGHENISLEEFYKIKENKRKFRGEDVSKEIITTGKLGSYPEDLFMGIFFDLYGPEKTKHLFTQYPSVDIYGNRRFIDFALESDSIKIAIEIDGETSHNPKKVSDNKYYDDLLNKNSLIYDDWKVYRWAYNKLEKYS